MGVQTIAAADAIARLAEFDAVIDARSESEFAEDRLPGAVNWPSLDDAQRHEVGTLYKQVSPFDARKLGAGLVAANIARHIADHVQDKPKGWQPLVYCWRGGQRSNSLALVLGLIGFRVHLVEGGYKAFRAAVLEQMPALAQRFRWRVICGATGSGKTRLLQALAAEGAQVLDLEALANHRSSVLGLIPGQAQPTQKGFDTRVWDALRQFDPQRTVWVESESRKVGNVAVHDGLMAAMRAGTCVRLELSEDERVRLLLEDYAFFAQDADFFCERLEALAALRGREQVTQWQALVRSGATEQVVRELLALHYDPGYRTSTARNFASFADAPVVQPRDRGTAAMREVARALVAADLADR